MRSDSLCLPAGDEGDDDVANNCDLLLAFSSAQRNQHQHEVESSELQQ
jgi:hypothetical protein